MSPNGVTLNEVPIPVERVIADISVDQSSVTLKLPPLSPAWTFINRDVDKVEIEINGRRFLLLEVDGQRVWNFDAMARDVVLSIPKEQVDAEQLRQIVVRALRKAAGAKS